MGDETKDEGPDGEELQGGDVEIGVQEGAESEVESPNLGDSPVGSGITQ